MRKATKILLTIASILAVAGFALMIAASVMGGGITQILKMAQNGEFNVGNWHFDHGIYFSPNLSTMLNGEEECEHSYDSEIKHIKIDVDFADVKIQTTQSGVLTVTMEKGILRYYEEKIENADTLAIYYDIQSPNVKNGADIVVSIPKDWEIESITVDNSMGDIILEEIETGCTKAKLFTSMGNVKVEESAMKEASLESNMGDVKFYGKVEGDLTLSTSMGDAVAEIKGNEDDYHISIDTNMGTAYYNKSEHHKDMRGSYERDSATAKADITISSSMGDVKLTINK